MPPHVSQATCNALIRRSIDLWRLYGHAAASAEPGLRVVLDENAHTLALLVTDLQAHMAGDHARPRCRESWRGMMRRHFTGWLAGAAPRRDAAWIDALMDSESALLRAFEQAIATASNDGALALRRQMPRLRGIHLDLNSLAGDPRS